MAPGQIDEQVLQRHLIALKQTVVSLRRYSSETAASLAADRDRRWAVERGLHLAAQSALDIAGHFNSALGEDPATYAASIDGLVHAGILPAPFGEQFRRIAGFRNVLVHGYLEVDLNVLTSVLRNQLSDFDRFAEFVDQWLAGNAGAAS